MTEQRLTRIAYTGGPCGGKTTALARSFDHFGKLGYRVVIVPEAATLLFNAGIAPGALTLSKNDSEIDSRSRNRNRSAHSPVCR